MRRSTFRRLGAQYSTPVSLELWGECPPKRKALTYFLELGFCHLPCSQKTSISFTNKIFYQPSTLSQPPLWSTPTLFLPTLCHTPDAHLWTKTKFELGRQIERTKYASCDKTQLKKYAWYNNNKLLKTQYVQYVRDENGKFWKFEPLCKS